MNWDEVRDEYINSTDSLLETAERCGVAYSSILRHSAKDHWPALREARLAMKEDDDNPRPRARESFSGLAEISDRLERALGDAVDRVAEIVASNPEELYRGWGRDVSDVTSAVKECLFIKRNVLEMPDQVERHRQSIDKANVRIKRELAELQRRKEDREKAKEDKTGGAIVVHVTGVEDGTYGG